MLVKQRNTLIIINSFKCCFKVLKQSHFIYVSSRPKSRIHNIIILKYTYIYKERERIQCSDIIE